MKEIVDGCYTEAKKTHEKRRRRKEKEGGDERYLYPSLDAFRITHMVAHMTVTHGSDVKGSRSSLSEEIGQPRFMLISHKF